MCVCVQVRVKSHSTEKKSPPTLYIADRGGGGGWFYMRVFHRARTTLCMRKRYIRVKLAKCYVRCIKRYEGN